VSDAPTREEIRRKARARAERMGLRTRPEPEHDADPADLLPTQNPGALRGMLATGRLDSVQQRAAWKFLADTARAARETDATTSPEDAA
jgi:hypothetical protein